MNRPSIFNSHMQRVNWLSKINESRKAYVERFNKLSKKENATKATAILFQIKEGIEKLIVSNQDSLKEQLSVIIEFLDKETKNSESLPDLAKMLLSRAKTFHKTDLFKTDLFATGQFKLSIKSYYERYNGQYWHISEENFSSILDLKNEINAYSVDVYALESLLKEIVNKNYPEEIKDLTKEELERELNNQGRPYDPSAPQEPIQDYVKDLIIRAKRKEPDYIKFWHFEGAHIDKPNKSQIIETLIETELIGELSKETVKDRVNRALRELGY